MIWYRHWLEMRTRVLVALLFLLVTCLLFGGLSAPAIITSVRGAPAGYGSQLMAAAYILTLLSMGSGVTSYGAGRDQGSSSIYYTLGLPASRTKLYSTRFLASALQVSTGFLLVFALNALAFAWRGGDVPWQALAVATTTAAIATLPVMALCLLLVMTWGIARGLGLTVVLYLVSMRWALPDGPVPAGIPWEFTAIALGTTAALFAVSLALIRRREF